MPFYMSPKGQLSCYPTDLFSQINSSQLDRPPVHEPEAARAQASRIELFRYSKTSESLENRPCALSHTERVFFLLGTMAGSRMFKTVVTMSNWAISRQVYP